MEDLALMLRTVFIGFIVLSAGSVVLASLARKHKISRYWPLGSAVALSILSLVVWEGSDLLGMVPLVGAFLTAAITYWPASKS
jgi:hypothetical protein